MVRNIVALIDLDDESSQRAALPPAIEWAKLTGARLYVLNVVPNGMYKMSIVAQAISEDYERILVDSARERLTALVKEHAVEGVEIDPTVRFGSVYREALKFARDVGADLIVMGAHKPGMADYLLGSNASQIVRHAKCSVWVMRE